MSDFDRRPIARFGAFELDIETGVVTHRGRRLSLAGQPIRLLEMFLRRPGDLLPLDDLHRALWPDDVHVDHEHGLRAAVRRLRAALDDTADHPSWIDTVPRKGYRYIGPTPEWAPRRHVARRSRVAVRAAASIAAVLIIVAALVWWPTGGDGQAPRRIVAVLTPDNLTGDPSFDAIADRIADDLISRLAQVDPERLGVIARVESRKFSDVTRLTYAMRTDFVAELGILREPGRIRLTTRLIRIEDRTQVWASSFSVETDAPDVATALANAASIALQAELVGSSR